MSEYRERFIVSLAKKLSADSDFAEECVGDVERHLEKPLTPVEGKFDDLLTESIAVFEGITVSAAQKAVKYARKKATISEVIVDDAADIFDLYKKSARAAGYSEAEIQTAQFDCRNIDVAENIQDRIFSAMRDAGAPDIQLGMVWTCYGPKVDPELEDDHVRVQPGFIIPGKGGEEA